MLLPGFHRPAIGLPVAIKRGECCPWQACLEYLLPVSRPQFSRSFAVRALELFGHPNERALDHLAVIVGALDETRLDDEEAWFDHAPGALQGSIGKWRRERDSNPRYGFPYTRVPGVRLQPLGHLSTAQLYRLREAHLVDLIENAKSSL